MSTRSGQCVQFLAACVHFRGKCVHFGEGCVHFDGACVHFSAKCVQFVATCPAVREAGKFLLRQAQDGLRQALEGLGMATRGARSVEERTVVLRVSGPRPGEQVFNLIANVFTFAADVFTFAGNVFSFCPNVFSSGTEVFSPRRGGIQFGDRRSSDRQAPRRHARGEPLRCLRTPSRPACRVGHSRSSFAVCVKRSLGLTRCRALQPIRPLSVRPWVIDSSAECFSLRRLEHARAAVPGPNSEAGAGRHWQRSQRHGGHRREQSGEAARRRRPGQSTWRDRDVVG